VDETYLKIDGRWRYVFRAIDEYGQFVDVYLSDRRNTAAARAFFEQSLSTSGVTPTRVTTNKAKCYPPALRTVLPLAEQRSSKYLNNGLERDHQHLKGRVRPMRRFKATANGSTFCRGHTLVRNLICGFSQLTIGVAPRLRLATAWATLTAIR
jgi:IS6 family transposase